MRITDSDPFSLTAYPWLLAPYQQWVEPFIRHKAHHALLVTFVSGSGEKQLISQLAQRILCLQPAGDKPCQICHACSLFKAGNHPDFTVLAPLENKQMIGIDQIRELSDKVYQKSQQGQAKVIWLQEAALMTEPAANALLKTLEEPPAETFFILSDVSSRPFLPTIRSRCSYHLLPVPALEWSIGWLNEHYPDYNEHQLASALLLNQLAPLAAANLLEPAHWQARHQFCQQLSQQLAQHDLWSLLPEFDQESAVQRLAWLDSLIRDALKGKQRGVGKYIINRDQVELIRQLMRYKTDGLTALYQLGLTVRQQLLTINGINRELVLCNLLAQAEQILSQD